MSAPTNGGPDWAIAFAEFHARHRDVKGKKLVFTAIFNAAMEAFIACPEVPMVWRVLAWIWRHSWGNSSDFCVDKIGGKPQGQQECADEFGVAKQRVNDCVTLLRELCFVMPPVRHMLYPVDDPAQYRSKNSEDKAKQSPDPSGLFREFCDEWKVRDLADFQELESAEASVNRIKIVRLGKYKEWLKARSNHAQPIKALTSQQVRAADQLIKEPTSSSSAVKAAAAVVSTPAPPPASLPPAPIESYVTEELSIDDEATQKLVAGCKEVEASITGPEIVELWNMEAERIQPRVRAGALVNPVGLLLRTVPKTVRSSLHSARDRIEVKKRDRAVRVAYAREAWDGLNEVERAEVLEKYPELQTEIGKEVGS